MWKRIFVGFAVSGWAAVYACQSADPSPTASLHRHLAVMLAADPLPGDRIDLTIGSVVALAVAAQAQVSLTTVSSKGEQPVREISAEEYAKIRLRPGFDEKNCPYKFAEGSALAEKLFLLSGEGISRVESTSARGERYQLIIGVIRHLKVPGQNLVSVPLGGKGQAPIIGVSYREPGFWLRAAGSIGDGWQLRQPDQSQFSIARIDQLMVPYGEPAAVGILITGPAPIGPTELMLVAGSWPSSRVYPLKVVSRQIKSC